MAPGAVFCARPIVLGSRPRPSFSEVVPLLPKLVIDSPVLASNACSICSSKDQPDGPFYPALPIIDTCPDDTREYAAAPYLLPGDCVQRDDGSAFSHDIHDTVNDDGIEKIASSARGVGIIPDDLQLFDVLLGDLLEVHVMGLIRPTAILFPGFMLVGSARISSLEPVRLAADAEGANSSQPYTKSQPQRRTKTPHRLGSGFMECT